MRTISLSATLFALAAVVGAAPLAAQSAPARPAAKVAKAKEPRFQDRPLSAWVDEMLNGAAPATRHHAAYALASLGPEAVTAVPALIKALDDPEPTVRYPVALALGEIGPAAKEAVPALRKALDDRNDDVAHIAKRSLRKITGETIE